jgi:hypothetical protein
MPVISSQSNTRYRNFHGRRPKFTTRKKIAWPRELIKIGKADAVCYISDKRHGGGNGDIERWRHEFGPNVNLWCSPDGKMLVIMGGRLNVKREGIVG